VCAGLEQALRARGGARLTYVNAWPEEGRGYNDLPDMAARAHVFDRALGRMAAMRPDAILIACNTLSIVYEHTAFKATGSVPVRGIIEGGIRLFHDALEGHPRSALVVIGTKTTIGSGVHRDRLLAAGVSPQRLGGASCHGLATAIERGPDSDDTASLMATCASAAAKAAPPGDPLFLGLACTHYGMVAGRLVEAVAAASGREVRPLDPNRWMVSAALAEFIPTPAGAASSSIEVMSKVELSSGQRDGVARLLEQSSPATSAALRRYTHVPDLF
jgi:glutamate racemase